MNHPITMNPTATVRRAIENTSMSYLGHQRHETRVLQAAARAARLDEHGALDDWAQHWLSRVRHEARAAGIDGTSVDALTMDGLVSGRQGHG